jgi:4-methyl-5(b-hydroxyethyl)-thiazole monophosphate biosynthesis
MSKRVLCLLAPGFEEIETVTPIDLLRRAGAEVVLASLDGEKTVTGRSKLTLLADAALADVADRDFDLLLVPGGPGVQALRADGRPAKLARKYFEAGKSVAAICAAPAVLKDANLLQNRKFTAHFSVYEELPDALAQERVVRDGKILTARGAGTAVDFGLAVVRELFGADKSDEIARSIMA